jgi:CxxC motif-containing protein (DUF1111 family)
MVRAQTNLFYVSTPASVAGAIIEGLGAVGLNRRDHGWTRIVLEKPFGRDLESAHALNDVVRGVFDSRLAPTDTTTLCKTTQDPEDKTDNIGMEDIDHFATFMRGTTAPPVNTELLATPAAQAGQQIFSQIGCALCHRASITTAPPGTAINGGMFSIPEALGNKVIHPYGDFLLHDVGTGDGIVQNGPPDTANKLRTAPLWGLRTRDRLMHDGFSTSRNEAILRHRGEANSVTRSYLRLTEKQKHQLLTFLNSL